MVAQVHDPALFADAGSAMTQRGRPTDGVDPSVVKHQLEQWLIEVLDLDAEIQALSVPAWSGHGDQNWFVSVRDRAEVTAPVREWVLRIENPTSVDLGVDFGLPFEVFSALSNFSDVPVPRSIALELSSEYFGAPFFITERVRGREVEDHPPYAFAGWLWEASVEEQRRVANSVIDTVANLHLVDARQESFAFLQDGRTTIGTDSALARWRLLLDRCDDGRAAKAARSMWPLLLDGRRDDPPSRSICWGEARLANMIFTDCTVGALLDFEDVKLGAPEADVGSLLFRDEMMTQGLGLQPIPGFPSEGETLERFGSLLGRDLENIQWWKDFAQFRYLVKRALRA